MRLDEGVCGVVGRGWESCGVVGWGLSRLGEVEWGRMLIGDVEAEEVGWGSVRLDEVSWGYKEDHGKIAIPVPIVPLLVAAASESWQRPCLYEGKSLQIS